MRHQSDGKQALVLLRFVIKLQVDCIAAMMVEKNKRKFAHMVCIKIELTPRGEKSYCSITPKWPP